MATTEAPTTSEQATEEFVLRVKRTGMQVIAAFVAIAGPMALRAIADVGITEVDWEPILIAGGTAAAVWVIAAVMNYFKPLQTNP